MSDANLIEIASTARAAANEAQEGYDHLFDGISTLYELGILDECECQDFHQMADRQAYKAVQRLEEKAREAEDRVFIAETLASPGAPAETVREALERAASFMTEE